MTAPLLMTGPGGDYVNRYDVKGNSLIKTRTSQSAGHDSDAQSSGSGIAWGFLGRRKNAKAEKQARQAASRADDRFEHAEQPAQPATYAKPATADLRQQLAMIQAIENWLTGQQDEVDRLAAIQTATEAAFAKPVEPAAVRVIRFNSKTMEMPTPAPSLVPEPCHAFATDEQMRNEQQDNPTPPERSVSDDQPEPHPQADDNFDINSRHPAIARLFADDERARRSARGLKGHHLRARRSAHQKGLPGQGCEQGALFGAVA